MNLPITASTAERHAALHEARKTLSKQQVAFCDAIITGKAKTRREAAIIAGCKEKSATQRASNLWNTPKVRMYMELAATMRVTFDTVIAAADAMDHLVKNAKSELVRFSAAKDTLDRVGMRAPERKDVRVAGAISVSIDLS